MTRPEQLPLPLPARPALGRGDYYVTAANALAVAMIDGWHSWPERKCVLTGPEGAGKTHLAHVWAAAAGARLVEAGDLATADVAAWATGPVCVEHADAVAGDGAAERALFHLHNLVLAEGHALLLTAREAPARWPVRLPDLASRLGAAPCITLGPPDDALLSAVLVKLFADRQLVPASDVVPYLVARIPRSHAAAARVVAALDAAALARGGRVTRPLAAAVLAGAPAWGETAAQ